MSSTKGLITKQYLTDIADAIRAKLGVQTQYTPAQMASAIASIAVATLTTKSISANGTYDAEDDNADGYSEVTVNVPPTAPLTQIAPTYDDYETYDYIANGTWKKNGSSVTYIDIYEVNANSKYIIMLGSDAGSRFRCAFFDTDPTEFTVDTAGTQVGTDRNSPPQYGMNLATTSSVAVPHQFASAGYLAVAKTNTGVSGIHSYLFKLDF